MKTCKICGEFILNTKKDLHYCHSCLRRKDKDIKLRHYYKKKISNEDDDKQIQFFKLALQKNKESYKTRKKLFTEELKKLGYNPEDEQARL